MGKGRLRAPGLLTWASGRATKGLLGCHCLWARLADHLEPGAKAKRSSSSGVPLNPRWRTQANCLDLWSVAGTGGLPVIFWEVVPISLELSVPEPLLRAED